MAIAWCVCSILFASLLCMAPSQCTPTCNQLLGENSVCNLLSLKDDGSQRLLPSYKLIYGKDPVTLTAQDHDCHIDRNQTLHLSLERLTEISDIFINEDVLVPRLLTVTLILGNASHECHLSEFGITRFGQHSFAKFSCHNAKRYTPSESYANAIEIKSRIYRELPLVESQQPLGLTFDWLILSNNRSRRSVNGDDATTGDTNGPGSDGEVGTKQQCPPIKPYIGMPPGYNNRELVEDGSINELLLRTPCKEGYEFAGCLTEINQCNDGKWQGNGFPKCEVLRTRTPPTVEHATWSYIHDDTFHQVLYTCQDGYITSQTGTTGKATYSKETDNWTNVPECRRKANIDWVVIGLTVAVTATICFTCACTAFVVLKNRKNKLNNFTEHQVDSAAALVETESGYMATNDFPNRDILLVAPENKKLFKSITEFPKSFSLPFHSPMIATN